MTQTQIQMPERMDGIFAMIAAKRGEKKEDVIIKALEEYIEHVPKNEVLSKEEVLAKLRRARGIWKDRTDLPDFEELRRSADRKLNWND